MSFSIFLPAVAEQAQLLFPSDKRSETGNSHAIEARCRLRVNRLRAVDSLLANDLPRPSGDLKASECYDSEIPVLEHAASEAFGVVGDHDGVRLGERLEPRGQVRSFAERGTLPRGTD